MVVSFFSSLFDSDFDGCKRGMYLHTGAVKAVLARDVLPIHLSVNKYQGLRVISPKVSKMILDSPDCQCQRVDLPESGTNLVTLLPRFQFSCVPTTVPSGGISNSTSGSTYTLASLKMDLKREDIRQHSRSQ